MTYPFEEVQRQPEAGIESIPRQMVRESHRFLCNLYENHPRWVVNQYSPTAPFGRQLMNSLCRQYNLPPPPPSQEFTDGQCPGQIYFLIYYELYVPPGDTAANLQPDLALGERTLQTPFPNGVREMHFRHNGVYKTVQEYINSTPGFSDPLRYEFFDLDGVLAYTWNLVNNYGVLPLRFEPAGSNPPSCGNPPPNWLPEPPPTINDLSTSVTINVENNETLDLDITINTSPDGQVRFPNIIQVNNSSISLDIRGAIITNNITNNNSGGGAGDSEFINPDPETPETPEIEEVLPPENESIEEDSLPTLVGLKIDITSQPINAKIVSGRGAPDLIYAGWVEFKTGDYYHPRIFIDFKKNIYTSPTGADGYAVTFKLGYIGVVTKILESN